MALDKIINALRIMFAKKHKKKDLAAYVHSFQGNQTDIPDLFKRFHKYKYGFGKKSKGKKSSRKSSRKVKK